MNDTTCPPTSTYAVYNVVNAPKQLLLTLEMGHRGILFANKYEQIGLPGFTDKHWDPVYALAQELDISVSRRVRGLGAKQRQQLLDRFGK